MEPMPDKKDSSNSEQKAQERADARYRPILGFHTGVTKCQVDAYVEGAASRDKEVDDLVAALELLLSNWPQHRDGMDHDVLPVGVKSARLLLSKRK